MLLSDTSRCPEWPESTPTSTMAKHPHTLAGWLWYKVSRHRQDLISIHMTGEQWEGEVLVYKQSNCSLMQILRWQDLKAQIKRWIPLRLSPCHGSGFGSLVQISISHGNTCPPTWPFSGYHLCNYTQWLISITLKDGECFKLFKISAYLQEGLLAIMCMSPFEFW